MSNHYAESWPQSQEMRASLFLTAAFQTYYYQIYHDKILFLLLFGFGLTFHIPKAMKLEYCTFNILNLSVVFESLLNNPSLKTLTLCPGTITFVTVMYHIPPYLSPGSRKVREKLLL